MRVLAGFAAATAAAAALLVAAPAFAATETVAAPAMPAPDAWVMRPQATVRVLDKLDASTTVLTLEPGQVAHFKSLSIKLGRCLSRPDGVSPDATAWVEIDDDRPGTPSFANWLFVAEPSLVMFQNPVFGVTLTGCAGAPSGTIAGHDFQPAPQPVAPAGPGGALPVSPGGAGAPPANGEPVPGIADPNAPEAAPMPAPAPQGSPATPPGGQN